MMHDRPSLHTEVMVHFVYFFNVADSTAPMSEERPETQLRLLDN